MDRHQVFDPGGYTKSGVYEGEGFYNVIFQELLEPRTHHW